MKHILSTSNLCTITGVQDGDLQPNCPDLRIDRVFVIGDDTFELSEDSKKMRSSEELLPDADGWFNLPIGTYDVTTASKVEISEGYAGWVIQRSTLLRNNITAQSAIYDSGYQGVVGCRMQVGSGTARIQRGTRIAQFVLVEAEALTKYEGSYGISGSHDKKYTN